ncbi:MAG: hypothetical protein LBH03_05650 [Holophagales bacterium]|nr:hypothetical protein [Holophagales bacterium]
MGKPKQTHILTFLAFQLGGIGVSGLSAQEADSPYTYFFKLRAGLTAGDIQKTHFDNKVMSMATEVRRKMFGAGQAISAELAFEYVPGRHHDIYPWDSNPILANDGISGLNPRYSFDNRKEYGQGVNLRLAYSAPLHIPNFNSDFEWFAGLSVDMFKVSTEVDYTFNFTPNTQNPAYPNYDGNTFVEQGSAFVPGVFGGVKCQLTKEIVFEMSLRNFGMRHYEFTPVSYFEKDTAKYGKKEYGKSSTGISRGWALEFALAVKI